MILKKFALRGAVLGAVMGLFCGAARAQYLSGLSFNSPLDTGSGFVLDDSQIIGIETGGGASLLVAMLTDMLPPEADIDAFDFVSSNRVYFSLDAPANLGGTIYQDEDVLLWDGAAISLAWSGAANGLPPEADIDALSIISESPLQFSFSLDAPASLAFIGGTFVAYDSDVIRWISGQGFVGLDFDHTTAGLAPEADVDAINRPDATTLLVSFDAPVSLAGGTLKPDDADATSWNFNTNTFDAIVFDAAGSGLPGEADLNGIELKATDLNPYDGRPVGDFDNSGCTDLNDFLFLLDYWEAISPIGGLAIGIQDFLALLDNWNLGATCPP